MPPVGFERKISAGEQPVAARLLRSWFRIPPGAWVFVCCECRVLSGRCLCDELITRPEESYQLWCVIVCDLETSRIDAPYIYNIRSLRVKIALSECIAFHKSCKNVHQSMPFTTFNLCLGGQEQFNLGGHSIFTYSHFLTWATISSTDMVCKVFILF